VKTGTLATLDQVKSWLNVNNSNDDVLLQRLIDSASTFVYSYLNLDTFAKSQYDEMYDAHGGTFMVLRQEPAISIVSLSINGTPVPAASGDGKTTPFTNGYVLFRQSLVLYGWCFPRCRNAVYVSYMAGYAITNEPQTVPGSATYTVTVNETWLTDEGVTLNGVAMTAVAANPGVNQYSVVDGVYTFNPAQANANVLVSYSYCPADINQAVIELVGERYRYKDRIGHSSKSLGGQETVAFQANTVPSFIKDMLNKYIRVVPA
jgi:hypothetical protein